MASLTEDKRMLSYELFSAYPGIFCFTTTRTGGSSVGAYRSFNCSPYCGDQEVHVGQNQELLRQAMPPSFNQWIIPVQVHGTEIALVDKDFLNLPPVAQQDALDGVDAVIVTEPGYCACVSTADCVPLLIYDRKHRIAAAVHAGWRGTVDGIALKTLKQMNRQFGTMGEDVLVAMGPAISRDSFEVGEEVYTAFREKGFDMSRISTLIAKSGKHHIDLWEANRWQLLAFGIPPEQIECAGICTFIHHETYFSARRLGIGSGRMLSGIMLAHSLFSIN